MDEDMGEGVEALLERIEAHFAWLEDSGQRQARERLRTTRTLENIIQAELNRRIRARLPASAISEMVDRVSARESDPYSAAFELLRAL